MADAEATLVGTGTLRRDGHLYRGEVDPFGIHLELHAKVVEGPDGRHFELALFYTRLPPHLRVALIDDPPAEA